MLPWVDTHNVSTRYGTQQLVGVLCLYAEGEFHDMMWALDSDHIFEGVEVVLSAMDSVMKDITENKERIEYGKDSAFYC